MLFPLLSCWLALTCLTTHRSSPNLSKGKQARTSPRHSRIGLRSIGCRYRFSHKRRLNIFLLKPCKCEIKVTAEVTWRRSLLNLRSLMCETQLEKRLLKFWWKKKHVTTGAFAENDKDCTKKLLPYEITRVIWSRNGEHFEIFSKGNSLTVSKWR